MKKKALICSIKVFVFLMVMILSIENAFAQVTIAFQGFEGTPIDNWTFTPPAQAGGLDPVLVGANTWGGAYVRTGNYSCRAAGGSTDCGSGGNNCLNGSTTGGTCTNLANGPIIEFSAIDISCYTSVKIEAYHRSHIFCTASGSGNGFDNGDLLYFEINLNGSGWVNAGLISGANNYIWTYSTSPVGASTQVTNPYIYNIPAGTQTVAFRTRAVVDRSDEVYYIDDVKISGTVAPPTLILATPLTACANGSADLTAATVTTGSTPGLVFSYWTDINATIPLLNSNNITTSGLYYIKGTSSAGCFNIQPIQVNFDPPVAAPSITLTQPDCITTTGTITVNSPVGAGYSYSTNGVNYSNTSGVFNGLSPANYSVTAQNANGCISGFTNVVIDPPPSGPVTPTVSIVQPSCTLNTATVTFNNPLGIGLMYTIDGTNYTSNTVFNNVLQGNYTAYVKDANGCISPVSPFLILPPLSIPVAPVINVIQPTCSLPTGSITIVSPIGAGLSYSIDGVSYTNITGIFNLVAPGSIDVTVQNTDGCISPITNTLINSSPIVPAPPQIVITQPTCTVPSGTIQIVSPTGFGFSYSIDGVNYSNTTGLFALITPSSNINVTVQNSDGCISAATPAVINVIPTAIQPSVVLSGITSFCPGGSVDLNAGFGYVSYQWLNNNIAISGLISQQVTINSTGQYSVLVTDINGCTAVSTVTPVTVFSVINPILSSATGIFEICPNDSLLLTTTSGFSNFQWYYNNVIQVLQTNSTLVVKLAGDYWVTAKDANGCVVNSDSVNVNIVPLPIASISPVGPIEACVGSSVSLQTSLASSYSWYNNGILIPSINSNFFDAIIDGNYSVELFNSLGCSVITDTVDVSFKSIVDITILADNLTPCVGDEVILTTDKIFPSIVWSNGVSGLQTSIYASGDYSVLVDSSGCSGVDTISIAFEPLPVVDAGSTVISDCSTGAVLNATASVGVIQWLPIADLSSDTILNPIANPVRSQVYTLIITNGLCSAKDSVEIIVDCSSIYIPSAFTPNEDGVNDLFMPLGKDIISFNFKVLNRWGQLLFETNEIGKGWDGKFEGEDCPNGLYVWKVEAFNFENKSILNRDQKKGIVSLIR